MPDSSGVRSASITAGGNSGASSRKSTPLWAHEIAPGLASRWPPPTMLATEAEWCGSLYGGRVISWSARWKPASECTAETSERVVQIEIGQQARHPFGEHGLADPRRTVEQHVVPAGRGYLAGPLGLDLTDHVGQVELAARRADRPARPSPRSARPPASARPAERRPAG